jgi:beta-phosphoglucomutase-like phosphatase (HAD superfamily)
VVIDDAEAGVDAGRAGGFGLVTGVARTSMFSGAVTLLA